MAVTPNTLSTSEYWMSPDALSIGLNAMDNPQYLQVSLLAGSVIIAYKQDVIAYDSSLNYQKWNLQAYNNFFDRTDRAYVYAQLEKKGNTALIVYSYDILELTETITNDTGESREVYNVYLGTISSSVNSNGESIPRMWETTFETGRLNTDKNRQEDQLGEWSKMFRLNKVTDMIEVLKDITSAVIHKLYIGARKIMIDDVQKSSDSENDFPASDSIIPTTKFLKESTEEKFHRKDQTDENLFWQRFLGGASFGEFIDSMIAGKGAGIFPDGRGQFERLEVRGSMTVLDMIINQIQGMESDYSFAEIGKISYVEDLGDETYRLIIEKRTDFDFMKFQDNDVCFSIINTLLTGGSDYYTSWMRILTTNVQENSITVSLYPDSEVPGGINYPPVAGYNLTRRGNSTLPEAGEFNERAQSWMLSSREGRIMFLSNVYKPILEDYNYALTIGKLPNIKALEKIPVTTNDVGVVSQIGIFERIYQFDYNGDVVPNKIDRGQWSLATAQGNTPYRRVTHETQTPAGSTYTLLEQHTVYHLGCKWGCLIDKTQLEPKWNSPAWEMLEGDKNYGMEFVSSRGWQFFRGQVNTDITAYITYSGMDITDDVMALEGLEIEWLRDSGNIPSDNSWKPTHIDGQLNTLRLTNDDMPPEWGYKVRTVMFICRIFIPVGGETQKIENYVGFNI